MKSEPRAVRGYVLGGVAAVVAVSAVIALAAAGSNGSGDAGAAATETTTETGAGTATSAPDDSPSPTVDDASETTLAETGSAPTTVHEVPADSMPHNAMPNDAMEERAPIGLDDTGDFGTGVTAEILDLRAVDGEARIPGEIAGPALRAEVRLTNDTGHELDLAGARIDITYGADRIPGIILGQPGVVRFPLSIEPGGQVTAASVFVVPLDQRDQVQVAVWYTVDAPILVFEGAAPTD